MPENLTPISTSRMQRRSAILEAAASVFFERGYAATSIDAVIERSGGSKRNIYDEFGNKEGLFTSLVSETADKALSTLSVEQASGRDLYDTLIDFGRLLLTIYMSPPLLGIFKIILSEASRFPELAKAFHQKGPDRAIKRLTELLENSVQRREIDVINCRIAADQFLGLLRGNLHLEVLLGLRMPPNDEESEVFVKSAVTIFMNGVRAGDR